MKSPIHLIIVPNVLLLFHKALASQENNGIKASIKCTYSTALYDDCEVALSRIRALPKPLPIEECMRQLSSRSSSTSSPSNSPSSPSDSESSSFASLKTYAHHRTCTIQVLDTTGTLECADPNKIAAYAMNVAKTCGDEWDLGGEFGGVMVIQVPGPGGQRVEVRVGGGDGKGGVMLGASGPAEKGEEREKGGKEKGGERDTL